MRCTVSWRSSERGEGGGGDGRLVWVQEEKGRGRGALCSLRGPNLLSAPRRETLKY